MVKTYFGTYVARDVNNGKSRSVANFFILKSGQQTEEKQPKLLKLERVNTASKISFDDTMDIERSHARCHAHGVAEPDSSDEEEVRERYRVEIIPSVMLEGEGGDPSSAPGDRRKMFAMSKSIKTCYSMPAPVRKPILEMSYVAKN